MTPQRIQRRRVKGWKMPEGAVYVGRPTKWGNPYMMHGPIDRATVVDLYKKWTEWVQEGRNIAEDARRELRGKNLVCWCKPGDPCHADVLLRIANEGDSPKPLDAVTAP